MPEAKRLYVGDPSEVVRRALESFFGSVGYDLLLGEGLEEFEAMPEEARGRFDLVMLGGDAPRQDPKAIHQRVRTLLKDKALPVILLDTDPSDPEQPGGIVTLGDELYVSRGASLLELLFSVRELIEIAERNRREAVRVWGGFKVHFRVNERWVRALIYNISRGGAFIETAQIPEPDTPVVLRFKFPESESSLEAHGVVRWRNRLGEDDRSPIGFGVAFREFQEQTGELLYRFVEERKL